LWQNFGNPVFPYFNWFFNSDLINTNNVFNVDFLDKIPKNPVRLWFFPLYYNFDNKFYVLFITFILNLFTIPFIKKERFKEVFYKFSNRYNKKPDFIYVVSSENEQYAIKSVELAKELGIWAKLNCQIPVGKATNYYPRYKLLNIYLQLIKLGLDKYESNLVNREKHFCPFAATYKTCILNKAVYVNSKEELIEGTCEESLSSNGKLIAKKGSLFTKCYGCKLFNVCNGCSVNRECTEPIKEEHCKWMKEHYEELLENNLIY
jgi:hypothetical protein